MLSSEKFNQIQKRLQNKYEYVKECQGASTQAYLVSAWTYYGFIQDTPLLKNIYDGLGQKKRKKNREKESTLIESYPIKTDVSSVDEFSTIEFFFKIIAPIYLPEKLGGENESTSRIKKNLDGEGMTFTDEVKHYIELLHDGIIHELENKKHKSCPQGNKTPVKKGKSKKQYNRKPPLEFKISDIAKACCRNKGGDWRDLKKGWDNSNEIAKRKGKIFYPENMINNGQRKPRIILENDVKVFLEEAFKYEKTSRANIDRTIKHLVKEHKEKVRLRR